MANSKCNNNNTKNYKFNVNARCRYYYLPIIAIILLLQRGAHASPSKNVQPSVKINKCCEKFEILVDSRCTNAASVNSSELFLKTLN